MLNFTLALVTGASSGIGSEISRLLAHKKIPLIITGRDQHRLALLAEELRTLVPVEVVIADLGNFQERQRVVESIQQRCPNLIINNAGFGLYGPALTHETHELEKIIDVNVTALMELTLEGARTLLSNNVKGTILNVSSSADFVVIPGLAVYAASKAFVTQFSRSFDEEMRTYGIRILTTCPGVVATEFRKRAAGGAKSESKSKRSFTTMSGTYAAEQLWNQLIKEQQVHLFDWKTRVAVFLARYILPRKFLSKYLAKTIQSYHPKREWILQHKNHNA